MEIVSFNKVLIVLIIKSLKSLSMRCGSVLYRAKHHEINCSLSTSLASQLRIVGCDGLVYVFVQFYLRFCSKCGYM